MVNAPTLFLVVLCSRLIAVDSTNGNKELFASTVFIEAQCLDFQCSGSGFAVWQDATTTIYATNAHVVSLPKPDSTSITVISSSGLPEEKSMPAKIVACSKEFDIAFVRAQRISGQSVLRLSDTRKLTLTQPIKVIGYPLGDFLANQKGRHAIASLTTGAITNLQPDADGFVRFIQINADINPGNSGGPVFDLEGGVIGIATKGNLPTDIGFALNSGLVRAGLDGLIVPESAPVSKVASKDSVVQASYTLIDPLSAISTIEAVIGSCSPSDFTPVVDATWNWVPLLDVSQSKIQKVELNPGRTGCTVRLTSWPAVSPTMQLRWKNRLGQVVYGIPQAIQPQIKPGSASLPGSSAKENRKTPKKDWITDAVLNRGSLSTLSRPSSSEDALFEQVFDVKDSTTWKQIKGTEIANFFVDPSWDYFVVKRTDGTLIKYSSKTCAPMQAIQFGNRLTWAIVSGGSLIVGLRHPSEHALVDCKTMTVKLSSASENPTIRAWACQKGGPFVLVRQSNGQLASLDRSSCKISTRDMKIERSKIPQDVLIWQTIGVLEKGLLPEFPASAIMDSGRKILAIEPPVSNAAPAFVTLKFDKDVISFSSCLMQAPGQSINLLSENSDLVYVESRQAHGNSYRMDLRSIDNLGKSLGVLEVPTRPRCRAFDPVKNEIWLYDILSVPTLMSFDIRGTLKKSYSISNANLPERNFIALPAGCGFIFFDSTDVSQSGVVLMKDSVP